MIIENQFHIGVKEEIHSIQFENDKKTYIAKVQYDRFKNVQILDIQEIGQDGHFKNELVLNDLDTDLLECFIFKEFLDSIWD